MKRTPLPFFTGREELKVDNRGRFRLTDKIYEVFKLRLRGLEDAIGSDNPEAYVCLTDDDKWILIDRINLYVLHEVPGIEKKVRYHSDEEEVQFNYTNVHYTGPDAQQRINPPDELKEKLGSKVKIYASKRGEFLHIDI